MSVFVVDTEECNSCGMCSEECPAGVIFIAERGAMPSLAPGGEWRCINCGHCVAVCPRGALSRGTMKPEECVPISKKLLPTAEQVEHFLKSRRSIRVYKEKPVKREVLTRLIDIARYAPSGANVQPVQWLVIEDSKEVKRLGRMVIDWMRSMAGEAPGQAETSQFKLIVAAWDLGMDVVMRGAPHLIVAHAQRGFGLSQVDCCIALTYLELAAYSLGLGACWNGFFQMVAAASPAIMEALALPEDHRLYGAMLVGHPKYRYRRIPLKKEPTIVWR